MHVIRTATYRDCLDLVTFCPKCGQPSYVLHHESDVWLFGHCYGCGIHSVPKWRADEFYEANPDIPREEIQ